MKKKYFKLILLFATGAILGVYLASLFFSWALQKSILVSDQLDFANNTGEIIHIIRDYNDGKVEKDYVAELLDRRIETLKGIKSYSYEILSRGKSNSKYAIYGEAIDQVFVSLEGVKEKVTTGGKKIDTEKDMDEFIEAVGKYGNAIQELL
ncbi:hypothetical protein ACIQ1D_18015 [Lysinibacillus xylanilyticus]|uniref:hypothetical protein n=1 Tax=Lysinibacillus xylanilyticus TaxID=582475 RepID=UPI00381B297B